MDHDIVDGDKENKFVNEGKSAAQQMQRSSSAGERLMMMMLARGMSHVAKCDTNS